MTDKKMILNEDYISWIGEIKSRFRETDFLGISLVELEVANCDQF